MYAYNVILSHLGLEIVWATRTYIYTPLYILLDRYWLVISVACNRNDRWHFDANSQRHDVFD